jgi:23S rRNA pseudouridine955/2504/2580 synthase
VHAAAFIASSDPDALRLEAFDLREIGSDATFYLQNSVKTIPYEASIVSELQPPENRPEPRSPARQIEVGSDGAGQRLDAWLRRYLKEVPKSRLYRLIRKGEVRVNARRAEPQQRLEASDVVRVPPVRIDAGEHPRRAPDSLVERINQSVIHEDEALIVLDKPAGIAVHGGSGVSFGVIEALRAARPGETLELVHRLDRDTSGCLLIARKASVLRTLHATLRGEHEEGFEKRYLALVRGKWDLGKTRIDVPLRTDLRVGGERTVRAAAGGKAAVSEFRPVQFFGKFASLVEVAIHTGRTHQIRVHAAYANHPVAGDAKYGDADFNAELRQLGLERMFLHAHSLGFLWPDSGRTESFNTPLPPELAALVDRLATQKGGRRSPRVAPRTADQARPAQPRPAQARPRQARPRQARPEQARPLRASDTPRRATPRPARAAGARSGRSRPRSRGPRTR